MLEKKYFIHKIIRNFYNIELIRDMGFKKIKIRKEKQILPHIIWWLWLIIIFSIGYFLLTQIDFSNIKLWAPQITTWKNHNNTEYELLQDLNILHAENTKTSSWLIEENLKVEEKTSVSVRKQEKNIINILLTWRGWGTHDAPNLTDTIILAHINLETKYINLFSIPRDLYVDYPNEHNARINGVYATYSTKYNSEEIGMQVLKRKISQITGEKINYYINIDFDGFIKIIDAIGWIPITVDKNFVDYQYPDGNGWYRTLIFKKWTWLFSGDNALKYARSRHSTSDFDRSLRQQEVIKAIKEKLTAGYFLSSPWKIATLYEIFKENVATDLKSSDIMSLALKLNKNSDYKIISTNLNDSCFYGSNSCSKWGFLYVPNREFFGWMSILLVEWTDVSNLNNYKYTRRYTKLLFDSPEVITENYEINIFNSVRVNNLAWALFNRIKRYGFNIPTNNSIWNTQQVYEKSVIYYNNISEDSITLKELKTFFQWEFIRTETPKYSKNNAKIELVIGKDYLTNEKVFNF